MRIGYFCEWDSHATAFVAADDPGPLGGESDVFMDGNLVGRYVDDSIGTPEVIQARVDELAAAGWANLYVGVPPALWGQEYTGAYELQEVYPFVNKDDDPEGFELPDQHSHGYILQAFDRTQDGVEGATYPSRRQQHKLFCAVRARRPRLVVWYFDQPEHRAQIQAAMRNCA